MSIAVSIVIPTKNSGRTLDKCLGNIFEQKTSRKFEVIIVDKNSNDDTIQIAKRYPVEILNCDGPLGMARKMGVNISKGEYIAFIDSDVYIDENWLERMLNRVIKEKLNGAIGRAMFHDQSLFARYLMLNIGYPYVGKEYFEINKPFPMLNTIILKKATYDVGNFDESLISCEDGDLTYRLIKKGYRFCFEPSAVCYHDHKQSLIEEVRNDIWTMKGVLICALKYGYTSWFFKTHVVGAIASLLGLSSLALLSLVTPTTLSLTTIFLGLIGLTVFSTINYLKTRNINWFTYPLMFVIKRFSTAIALIFSVSYYIFGLHRKK